MTTNTPTPQERTDPRPKTTLLGIDTEGAHHVWRIHADRVHVVRPDGTREHVEDLRGWSVEEWLAFVEDRRGIADRRYGLGLAEMLGRALEAEA